MSPGETPLAQIGKTPYELRFGDAGAASSTAAQKVESSESEDAELSGDAAGAVSKQEKEEPETQGQDLVMKGRPSRWWRDRPR